MKREAAIVLVSLVAVTAVYATGVSYDLIPSTGVPKTIPLSWAKRNYKVSGIGISQRTKAAIINNKVIMQGSSIDKEMVLRDVKMDGYGLSADNVEVSLLTLFE